MCRRCFVEADGLQGEFHFPIVFYLRFPTLFLVLNLKCSGVPVSGKDLGEAKRCLEPCRLNRRNTWLACNASWLALGQAEGVFNPAKSCIKVFPFHEQRRFVLYTFTQSDEA